MYSNAKSFYWHRPVAWIPCDEMEDSILASRERVSATDFMSRGGQPSSFQTIAQTAKESPERKLRKSGSVATVRRNKKRKGSSPRPLSPELLAPASAVLGSSPGLRALRAQSVVANGMLFNSDESMASSSRDQVPIDVDEDRAENSSTPYHKRCPNCPFSGYGFGYDRHMRGHESEFALKCEVPGCGWTHEHKQGIMMHTRMHKAAAAAAASEPSSHPVTKEPSQAPTDVDEDPAESSPQPHPGRCLKCPFSGHRVLYERHMRGHENNFAWKCQVAGCGWTTEHPPGMASHSKMHKTAAAAAASAITQTAKESPAGMFRRSPSISTVWSSKKRKGTSLRPQSPELLPPTSAVTACSAGLKAPRAHTPGVAKAMPFKSAQSTASSSSASIDTGMVEAVRAPETPVSDPGSGQDGAGLAELSRKSIRQTAVVLPLRASATKAAAMMQAELNGQEFSPRSVPKDSTSSAGSQTSIDVGEVPKESSPKPWSRPCPKCPFSGYGLSYYRHMRGHENEFALKCEVAGCGWTTEHPPSLAAHTEVHRTAAAAALGTLALGTGKSVTPEPTQQAPQTISRAVRLKSPAPPPLMGPPPANPDIPSVSDYSCLASTWKQYEEIGYTHMETSSKEGWTKEKLISQSGVKGRSLDICRLKWTSGLKSIPIWQLEDSDEFLGGVPFNERTAGELRFAVQDCGAMRIDPAGVGDGSWFNQYVRPGMSDGRFLRTRPHMTGLNSYMYEPTLNGHYIRRAIEQDAKLKKNKTIQQIIETAYKKQLSIPLLLRKQIHDVNFWSTSADVLFFSAHPNAYYEQIDDPFILSSLEDRNNLLRDRFPFCSKYGLLSSYPINIHTFGGRFEEIMLNWIAGPGLTTEWLHVNAGGTGTPFHHEPGGLASVNQNLGIIPPEGAVQTHPSSKIWTINCPAAYADFTHVMTSTGGEGNEYKLAYLNKEGGISRGLTNAVFPADNRPCTTTEQPVGSFIYVGPGVLHQVDNTGPTMSVARNIIDQLWIESGHIFIDQILGSDAKNPGGILGCCYKEAEEQAIRDNYKLRLDLQNRPEEFTTYMTVRTLMRCRTQDEKIAAKMDFELLKYMGGDWIEADKTILGLNSVVSQGEVCVLENGGGAFPVPPNHIIYNELTRKKYYPADHRH